MYSSFSIYYNPMQNNKNIINRVKYTVLKYKMLKPGDRVVVAVSGGPDSVCLLDIMAELSTSMNVSLIIAHYNHGLRDSEDANENRLVKKLAEKHSLPIECEKASGLENNMASLEEIARNSRYAFLDKVKSKHNANKIALGHNLNDQAETFLMRLLRGSGMTGLSGIPPVRDKVFIRPLIETDRNEILDYLDYHKIEYAIDSSNLNKKHLRNRIRLELIPELIKYQPNLVENFGRLAAYLREENEFIHTQAEKWVETESRTERDDCLYIKLPVMIKLPRTFAARILRIIISKFITYLHGIDAGHIDSIFELMENQKPNAFINLPKGLIVKKEYDKLVFSLDEEEIKPFNYIISEPGTIYIEETGQRISIKKTERPEAEPVEKSAPGTELINGDKVQFPLTLRNFLPGDKFIPLGMKGRKKVKDYFIDLKIPVSDRRMAPILLQEDEIICICGYRIDECFKVTPDTKTVLKCKIE